MTRRLQHKPLCPRCVLDGGWDYSEPDNPKRCDHGQLQAAVAAAEARDAGLTATAEAHPDAMKAALQIIRDTALALPVFSSNDTRAHMKIAQVPRETIGAAFRQAAKDGVIRGDSYIPSTDPGTHGHPVRTWASLIYRAGRAVS